MNSLDSTYEIREYKWNIMLSKIASLILLVVTVLSNQVIAKDLEPRRWTPLPLGTSVVALGIGHTMGDLYFDPVMEVSDAEVEINTVVLAYIRSFSLADRLARFDVRIPHQSASWEGFLSGEPANIKRVGFSDPRFRLSINLLGAPAVGSTNMREYKVARPSNTIIGASIAVSVPWGEYFDDKLLNLGKNRYSIRPQIGAIHTDGLWSYELTSSVFYFTDNKDFYADRKRGQKPLYATQAHLIRTFGPGLWGSLSAGYAWGGESKIDGIDKDDKRKDFLSAVSFGFPVSKTQSLKLSYVRGRTKNDVGVDTDSLVLAGSMLF